MKEVHEGQVINICGVDYKVFDCEWDNEITVKILHPEESNGQHFGRGGDVMIMSIVGLQEFLEK